MQQFDVLIQFRRDAAKVYGEPREALSYPEIVDEMVMIISFYPLMITYFSFFYVHYHEICNDMISVLAIALRMESKQRFRM